MWNLFALISSKVHTCFSLQTYLFNMFADPELCNKVSIQILELYSVAEDTYQARFLIHILLQKIPFGADSWFTFCRRRYHAWAQNQSIPPCIWQGACLHKKPKQQVEEMSLLLMIEFWSIIKACTIYKLGEHNSFEDEWGSGSCL
jgi:hypothetical protein